MEAKGQQTQGSPDVTVSPPGPPAAPQRVDRNFSPCSRCSIRVSFLGRCVLFLTSRIRFFQPAGREDLQKGSVGRRRYPYRFDEGTPLLTMCPVPFSVSTMAPSKRVAATTRPPATLSRRKKYPVSGPRCQLVPPSSLSKIAVLSALVARRRRLLSS